ncbi:MAG: 3'-5' exonuclease [Gammaproteobacteria bacterium]|nr:3'-5' exonuclease [Gammaproteobacteria bacterium]MDH5729590.1 3'-5' exonuclease [Gammaproteobacteria bacterium]
MNVFVFDIETIPDVEGGRRLYDLQGLSDKEVAQVMFHKRRQETGTSEFLRHHLHRVVAISAVFRHRDKLSVWSLGDEDSSEKEIIQRFFDGLDRYTPTLVSWNGGGFDLPVLHYRALVNGVSAPRYWDLGEDNRDFKWNNYFSRYHMRHTDLMDVLAGFQPRANAPLDEIATLLGFPGKMGMSGAKVWDAFMDGDIKGIRNYCETDVLNTYLVYLRFELMRGHLDSEQYENECQMVRDSIAKEDKQHFNQFLQAWQSTINNN